MNRFADVIKGSLRTGVRQYGRFLYVVSGCILAAVIIIVFTGFSTTPDVAVRAFGEITGIDAAPRSANPSIMQFFSVVALFTFAYGGLSGGSSLGGETVNPASAMPRGIVMGWALALVSYTLVAFVVHQPEKAWYFQPWFQVCVSVGIALALARHVMKRHGRTSPGSFRDRFLQVPD